MLSVRSSEMKKVNFSLLTPAYSISQEVQAVTVSLWCHKGRGNSVFAKYDFLSSICLLFYKHGTSQPASLPDWPGCHGKNSLLSDGTLIWWSALLTPDLSFCPLWSLPPTTGPVAQQYIHSAGLIHRVSGPSGLGSQFEQKTNKKQQQNCDLTCFWLIRTSCFCFLGM